MYDSSVLNSRNGALKVDSENKILCVSLPGFQHSILRTFGPLDPMEPSAEDVVPLSTLFC